MKPIFTTCGLLILFLTACSPRHNSDSSVSLQQALGGVPDAGFLRAIAPRQFEFPRDHGPHDGYRNEWWYITGNLETDTGRQFGIQVTFFRIALGSSAMENPSRWAANHVWMAHAALTDPDQKTHFSHERFSREALGLAGARQNPFNVWLGDWSLSGEAGKIPWQLHAGTTDFDLKLELVPLAAPILQGDRGLSQKSSESGNASYYYSISRLQTAGILRTGQTSHTVTGLSWMDREWSSSALGAEQVGWDWFSMQLDDGTDVMFYHLRTRQGESDVHSAGSVRNPDGRLLALGHQDVKLTPKRWWHSSGGADYPVAWEVAIKPLNRQWRVEAVLDQQEMAASVNYWEGMVTVSEDNQEIGKGYLEMTGYR